MPVSAGVYGQFSKTLVQKEVHLINDDIKVMLTTSTYTPDRDAHVYKSSVTNEVTGTGYTAGGLSLTSKSVTYDAATDTVIFTAANAVWANSTITARRAVIYDATPGTDATRPLLGWVDFGADFQSSGSNFTVQWDATGILGIAAL